MCVSVTLADKQQLFTLNTARLIAWATTQGYGLTYGEAYRTPEQALINAQKGTGIANSLHISRLAVDFNLFINGVYHSDPESYTPLGIYWKSLHPLNRFGGDFKSKDANHFSMTDNGVS